MHQGKNRKNEHGQIFALLAAIIPILIVFIGLSVDYGMAYIAKTTLSKAVDAAALAAMKNVNQGQTTAAALAQNVFKANYQSIPGLGNAPTLNVVWSTDSNGNTLVTLSATATINTYFLRVMSLVPGVGNSFNSTNISVSAQAIRNPLVMSLVLDKSGSMNLNGGSGALPGAVTNFISYFDNTVDNVAEISFSSIATIDVSMNTGFVGPITTAVNNMSFGGATFAQAGLQDGLNQILTKPIQPNIIRVAVFFTDGWANTNNDNLDCANTGKNLTNLNYGGCAPLEAAAGWCNSNTMFFISPTTGNYNLSCGAKTFPDQMTGNNQPFSPTAQAQNLITNDATYRTEGLATTMRTTDDITIYAIGLGDKINQPYLQAIANDPAGATYNSSQPAGEAVFAPNASQLAAVFETIASKILLRLSR